MASKTSVRSESFVSVQAESKTLYILPCGYSDESHICMRTSTYESDQFSCLRSSIDLEWSVPVVLH
eukprot:2496709-Ditylum_brightwellii.AAC.1